MSPPAPDWSGLPGLAGLIEAVTAAAATPPAPGSTSTGLPGPAGSLAAGAAGIALWHIERARAGTGEWASAHAWLAHTAAQGVDAGAGSTLFSGAPALAFLLHGAAGEGGYCRALAALDATITDSTQQRLATAHARIDTGAPTTFREYDLLSGLTGLGAHHLRRHPEHPITSEVLAYLVRLTQPLPGAQMPGWWVSHAPSTRSRARFVGGHANLGMAHGITGPLALLALAAREGILVTGHLEAIDHLATWLESWAHDREAGPWWPETLTTAEHHAGTPRHRGPGRPSWCYGTPGIARALQLAGLATGNAERCRRAEEALLACWRDPDQIGRISEPGLCHGWAGLLLATARIAADAAADELGKPLLGLVGQDSWNTALSAVPPSLGFLDGHLGLALTAAALPAGAATGWERCLLLR